MWLQAYVKSIKDGDECEVRELSTVKTSSFSINWKTNVETGHMNAEGPESRASVDVLFLCSQGGLRARRRCAVIWTDTLSGHWCALWVPQPLPGQMPDNKQPSSNLCGVNASEENKMWFVVVARQFKERSSAECQVGKVEVRAGKQKCERGAECNCPSVTSRTRLGRGRGKTAGGSSLRTGKWIHG